MSRPIVKAVVFDLDGILIDSEPAFVEAARRVLASRGQVLDEEFMRSVMGMPGRVVVPMFRERFRLADHVEQLACDFREHFAAVIQTEPLRVMPGVWEIIAAVERREIPRAIATSSSRRYVEHVIAPSGFVARFPLVLTCDDVTHAKPDPEIYVLAARQLSVRPGEMLVIEDSPAGVTAAKAAGAFCVAVPHSRTDRSAIAAADLVVESLTAPALTALIS